MSARRRYRIGKHKQGGRAAEASGGGEPEYQPSEDADVLDDELDESEDFESVDFDSEGFDPSDFSLELLLVVLADRDDDRLSVR
jgi:hypothetical protein